MCFILPKICNIYNKFAILFIDELAPRPIQSTIRNIQLKI